MVERDLPLAILLAILIAVQTWTAFCFSCLLHYLVRATAGGANVFSFGGVSFFLKGHGREPEELHFGLLLLFSELRRCGECVYNGVKEGLISIYDFTSLS